MPHIIVEYSKNLEDKTNVSGLLIEMHEALTGKGIDAARIKTRAIALDHVIIGDMGASGAMMHATLLLLEGRDLKERLVMGDALHDVMKNSVAKDMDYCSVTLDIREMDRDTYCM